MSVELPLFPGYLFCRFARAQSHSVRQTPGVVSVVSFAGKPAPIATAEIDAIRAAIESGRPVRPWEHPAVGDRVRIEQGPLAGVTGVLVREKGEVRVVLSVELLRRAIAVEIERDAVSAVPV